MKTPTLETKRLILRPIRLEDAPDVQRQFGHWKIIQYISNAQWPYPDDAAETFLRDVILPGVDAGKMHVWAITLKGGNGDLIGMINYRVEASENDNRGFWLAIPYHGQGLMTEAVCIVNDFVFNQLGVMSFRARNLIRNLGSHRIKAKTGGRIIGETTERMKNGNEETLELWEITKESWEEARKSLSF